MAHVWRLIIMDRPLVAIDMIPLPPPRGDLIARQPEDFPARRLQIIPDPGAIGREELMARNFHVHDPLVDQLLATAVGADRPDPVDLVPRPFVAIHDEAGVRRRKLDMVEPIRRSDDDLPLAGADVDGEDLHWNLRFQPFVQAHFLRLGETERLSIRAVGGIMRLAEGLLDLRRPGLLRAVGLKRLVAGGPLAKQQRFVGIDRPYRTAIDRRDFAGLAAVDIRHEDGGAPRPVIALAAGIIGRAGLAPGEQQLQILALDQRLDGPVGQRHHRYAVGRRYHHLVALGRIAVLMEIEAGAARLVGQAQDTVAGRLVDPFGGGLCLRGSGEANHHHRGPSDHRFAHPQFLFSAAAHSSASGMRARFWIAANPHCDAALVETPGHSTVGPTKAGPLWAIRGSPSDRPNPASPPKNSRAARVDSAASPVSRATKAVRRECPSFRFRLPKGREKWASHSRGEALNQRQ